MFIEQRKGAAVLGIGGGELVIILIFGFLIFGPDKLPSMGRTIGRALRQFRQAQDQMNKMVKTEIYDPLNEAVKEPAKKQGPKEGDGFQRRGKARDVRREEGPPCR